MRDQDEGSSGAPVDTLAIKVTAALERRSELRRQLWTEGTDCYRLFHGIAEGAPGLCIDRYGSLLLLQTFREPLPAATVEQLARLVQQSLGESLDVVCNHRGSKPPPGFDHHQPTPQALGERVCCEAGVQFLVQARHRGQDPWLFLDMRPGRRKLRQLAKDRRVLNLFAYTCSAGVVAKKAGAAEVVNVDFAGSALQQGRRNAAQNDIADDGFVLLESDCIPILRQLGGMPVQRQGQNRPYTTFPPRPFDLVFLDPPRFSKSPFGAVDVTRDYAALFKPCILTLAPGGVVIASNHVPEVEADAWCGILSRCAEKAGRPLQSLELHTPDADFPAFDGKPPLKLAVCQI